MRIQLQAFLASLFLSRLADQVLLFLVPLAVFQATQSAAWSGLAFSAEALCRFASFPVCGALCDRHSPLKLLRASQVLRAAACAAGVAGHQAFGGIGWLVGLAALCGVLTTQGTMAREVMLPQVFAHERFARVMALAQAADQLGAVLAPVLAAALLAVWPWQGVVGAAGALFVLADAAIALWRRRSSAVLRAPEPRRGHWLLPLRVALVHLIRLPGLARLVVQSAGVNLVVGVTLASSAALVTGGFGQSEAWYAGLQAVGAVATVAILLGIARVAVPVRWLGAAGFACIFAGGLLTALATHPALYAAGFLLVIGFDKMFSIYMRTQRQQVIPPADYGKTLGAMALLNNLTQPLAGAMVAMFAASGGPSLVILVLTLLMGALGFLSLRR